MKYKLLAPLRTDFSLFSEVRILYPEAYKAFWDAVLEEKAGLCEKLPNSQWKLSPALDEYQFPHASKYWKDPFNRYQSLDSDSLECTQHLMELHLDGETLPEKLKPREQANLQALGMAPQKLILWVFNHHINLLEVDFKLHIPEHFQQREDWEVYLDNLQHTGIQIVEQLARRCTDDLLEPLFQWLEERPVADKAIVAPRNNVSASSHQGSVLWAARTLIFEHGDEVDQKAMIKHWLKDTLDVSDKQGKKRVREVIEDDTQHLTLWLNYLFRENAYPPASERPPHNELGLAVPFCDAWEAMLYAQFFYSALEVIDAKLTGILAKSLSNDPDLDLDALKEQLEQHLRNAKLLLLRLHDSAKYYKRTVKSAMDGILDGWNFEKLLVEPVNNKIDLCQERLELLHRKDASKAATNREIILMAFSIATIFATGIALAEYGRTMAAEADLARYDVHSFNVIDYLAGQSTDVILLFSGSISAFLLAAYLFYRKRHAA